MSHRTIAVIPAEPNAWVGLFKKRRVPVIAWALREVTLDGDERPIESWTGIGVWQEGPSEMEDFADFESYEPTAGWAR